MVQKFIVNAKNTAISLALKTYLNERFGSRLNVSSCALDTGQRRLRIEGSLHRFPFPVHVTVEQYRLECEGNQDFVVIAEVSSSFWLLTRWLIRRVTHQRFAIPASIAALL